MGMQPGEVAAVNARNADAKYRGNEERIQVLEHRVTQLTEELSLAVNVLESLVNKITGG